MSDTPSIAEDDELAAADSAPQPSDENTTDPRHVFLLNRLLYKGVLPRYAFPTDVATFYVFDPNRSQFTRPAFRFSPSQGLAIALTSYGPGKEVWIDGKRFESGAIYSPIRNERFNAWKDKCLYYECSNCHYACTRALEKGVKGEIVDCPACGREDTFGQARYWFRPSGFAHPVGRPESVSPDDTPAKSYATRAKLNAPTPEASAATWRKNSDRTRVHYLRDKLLVTNTGPRQEGYTYCTICGMIEPTSLASGKLLQAHPKPYPDVREPNCRGGMASTGVCLGTDFITDILLISMRVKPPVRLTPGMLATEIALRTVSEAIAKATSLVLDLENGEVQADFRAALTDDGQSGLEAEIYLYDTLAGGAGFSRIAGEQAHAVFEKAVELLGGCDCDSSCYRCLRSFKNKFEHDRLDRRLGLDLLRYLLFNELPILSENRTRQSVLMLSEDVKRQSEKGLAVDLNASVSIPGIGAVIAPMLVRSQGGRELIVAISHPLSSQSLPTKELEETAEYSSFPVFLVHELRVRRSLPSATRDILAQIGDNLS
ncbi:MAG: DUF1998 domain-containing protein [Acidobacteriota bacterium]|nr:DUF1998 domain-containing protein [Acidobacteriota bacterium]